MKQHTLRVAIISLISAVAAEAGPVVTADPSTGIISGASGDTIGWGFLISADPSLWISFVGSLTLFETDPSIGFYSDLVGVQGGPVNGVLASGAPDWIESFDLAGQTGVGSFTIDPSAVPGAADSGTIRVLYATYTGDPNVCGSCGGTPGFVDVPFDVEVVPVVFADAPEPGSWWLCLAGAGCILFAAGGRRYWGASRPG